MSFDTYCFPWGVKSFYAEQDSTFPDVHSSEELAREDKKFESASHFMTDTSHETPCSCTETPKRSSDLRSSFTYRQLDNIYSNVLSESSHESELDFNKQIFDFPPLQTRVKSPRASAHCNDHPNNNLVGKFCESRSSSRRSVDVDSPKDRQHTCSHCGKTFKRSWYLQKHLKIHSDTTNISCEVCKLNFRLQSELMRHMSVHHFVENPHICPQCRKVFKTAKLLTRHYKIHVSKYFPCEMCNKLFKSENNLAKHVVSHSAVKLPLYDCQQQKETLERSSHCHEAYDKENRTTELIELGYLLRSINSYDAGTTGFSSAYGIPIQTQPSNYPEHDGGSLISDTRSAIHVALMSPGFETAQPIDVCTMTSDFTEESYVSGSLCSSLSSPAQWKPNWWTGDPIIPCDMPETDPDYILTAL